MTRPTKTWQPREVSSEDADEVARLLHNFNSEYGVPSPGVDVLAGRLRQLLAGDNTFAIVAGTPAVGVALVTTRTNVWYSGAVALLDELYVAPQLRGQGIGSAMMDLLVTTMLSNNVSLIEINVDEGDIDAQRFYERHGFSAMPSDGTERALYYSRELGSDTEEAR